MPTRAPSFQPHPPWKKPQTDRQATRALNTGSKAWRGIREAVLTRDLYRCHDCGKYGDEVDHDDEDSHNNDWANLVTRCRRCHSAKTMRAANGARR